ncbi:MAG: mechanosensitive ion channel [Proteobacteria bacterium]|nr:mechanosensitive ion channel [Pseudomonadota bacterium]
MLERLKLILPPWMHEWLDVIVPGAQIALIMLAALLLQHLLRRVILRASDHYQFPHELLTPINGVVRWLILGGAGLLALERLGVSAAVLWTAFTGFATVGAVAFFAAWSVLSNLFCAFLIFTVGPFRVGDHIELLDTAEKPGALGRVVDINLLYTTLEDATAPEPGSLLQIPNALIFQRVLRRWPEGVAVPRSKLRPASSGNAAAAGAESAAAPKGASFP